MRRPIQLVSTAAAAGALVTGGIAAVAAVPVQHPSSSADPAAADPAPVDIAAAGLRAAIIAEQRQDAAVRRVLALADTKLAAERRAQARAAVAAARRQGAQLAAGQPAAAAPQPAAPPTHTRTGASGSAGSAAADGGEHEVGSDD